MKNKLIKSILALIAIFTISMTLISPTFAVNDICDNPNIPIEVQNASGCSNDASDTFPIIITNIVNAIIGILGVVAVIAIVVGGIWYTTSTGDAGKVKKAKDTILYACIGLVVCALAAIIVNWAIGIINSSSTAPDSKPEEESSLIQENSLAFLEKKL